MSGISPVGAGSVSAAWRQRYYHMGLSAARAAAANPARVNVPVEPVDPVRPIPRALAAVRIPVVVSEPSLPTEKDLNNASENLVRMRIEYLSPAAGEEEN